MRQFKRLVHHGIQSGRVRPTDLDPFSIADITQGPTAYTVNEQLIKPVTAAAGNVSWALMKYPAGLLCEVFVTHAWAEGIFDFVDKVAHSWPRGAVGAYVCFLSNPQNQDIASLIQNPRESPFANALHRSSSVLAMPNRAVSIYTRVWCVYEAFLASSWDKPIRIATRPSVSQWPKVVRVPCAGLAACGTGILVVMSQATGLLLEGVLFFVTAVFRPYSAAWGSTSLLG